VVLQMWDGDADPKQGLNPKSKDVPCNLTATFDAAQGDGRLHMTVFNRSNDIVWGATGANIVHFSILQEYVASALGMGMGVYEQISTNSHLYLELNEASKKVLAAHNSDPTRELRYVGKLSFLRDVNAPDEKTTESWQSHFDLDIKDLMSNYDNAANVIFRTQFFKRVVQPVMVAFNLYKDDDLEGALTYLHFRAKEQESAEEPWYVWHDWNIAAYQWIQRRVQQRNAKVKEYLNADRIEEFETNVRKVWKNANKVVRVADGYDFAVDGDGNQTVARFYRERKEIMYRGLTDYNR
jgi:predicted nucleic acid-binding protein